LGFRIYQKRSKVLGATAITTLKKENLDLHYDGFYEPKPNIKETPDSKWLKGPVTYTINSDTLNERFNYTADKPPNTFRIITLGDSFTFGENASTATNYPETLEKILNESCSNKKYEVINLGVPGYDIDFAMERYQKRGEKYNPDLVLWFLKDDDFEEIKNKIIKIEKKYTSIYDKKGHTINAFKQLIAERDKAFKDTYDINKVIAYNEEELPKISDYYKGQLLLFTFPFVNDKYRSSMKDLVKNRDKTHFFDQITDVYSKNMSYPDGHPNPAGYQQIANDLFNYLIQEKLVPCN
jgi:hypothetical protein